MADEPKSMPMTVRQLRSTFTLNDALKPSAAELTREPWQGVDSAEAFYGRAFRAPVKWGKFFEEGVSTAPDLFNEAAVGFIYLPLGSASYVVSFGPAQNYLNEDAFVRSFGLKVVLNSVHESLLRGMDLNTPEELSKQRRVQTSRLTTADNFGVEIDRDILKQAVGAPTDKTLGAQIAGADSLKVAPKILASQLGPFCTKLGTIAAKTDYRTKGFDWVDKIRPVKEKDLVDELDDILLKKLRALLKDEAPVEVHLAPPEIIEPASIDEYKFAGYGSRKGAFDSLEIDNFRLDYLRNRSADELTLKEIRKTFSILVKPHGSSSFGGGWSFYRCLVTEVDRQGQVYVLSGGLWYEVEKDYAKLINGWFTSFLGSHAGMVLMDAQKKETEPAYISRLRLAQPAWACLDTDEIKITGASHGVEPCDFLTDAGEFLHLKSEATSSKLSHLFNQGLVSAELFLMSQEFRTTLKDSVVSAGKAWPLGDPVNEPDRSTVRVNYAVMRRPLPNGTLTLPFFSKVSLRSVVNRLELLSVPVSFSWVRKVL
jgi:uncharacterized protein (TIGR04141 family)